MIFYSKAESQTWGRDNALKYPPLPVVSILPTWFVHEALKLLTKESHDRWCDLNHRPEWERMKHAVEASMIWAEVELRMEGSKPFQETHCFQIAGIVDDFLGLMRQQVAFSCPPNVRRVRNNMRLCKKHIEETQENKDALNSTLIIVNDVSITPAGNFVFRLHDSVRMSCAPRCENGNPIIGVGEKFSAGVWIEREFLAFDFQLTMTAEHM
jgi:hypothetical protein